MLGILRTRTCTLPVGSGAFGRAEKERHPVLRFLLDDRAVFRAPPVEREATAVAVVVMCLPYLAPRHRLQASAALVRCMVLRPVV